MLGRTTRRSAAALAAVLAVTAVGAVDATARSRDGGRPAGTVWVGNRGFPAVAAFDASSRTHLMTVPLTQPASDVAVGRFGKVFVGEENGDTIAVIDEKTGKIVDRIVTADRPHHLEASRNGRWITYGAYGTNVVGVIDARTGELVHEWPASDDENARSHASVITPNGKTVYVANDSTHEVTGIDVRTGDEVLNVMVHHAHELVLTRDQRTLYVVSRMGDMLFAVDIRTGVATELVSVGPMPDTLELVDHDRMLTVGLRGTPAQIAVVDLQSLEVDTMTIAGEGTTAGHQWTSPNGRWTIAAFEGGTTPGIAVIDHRAREVVTEPFPGGGRPHGLDLDR
jgi:DNA-binding beta-propeller fold protein YncE